MSEGERSVSWNYWHSNEKRTLGGAICKSLQKSKAYMKSKLEGTMKYLMLCRSLLEPVILHFQCLQQRHAAQFGSVHRMWGFIDRTCRRNPGGYPPLCTLVSQPLEPLLTTTLLNDIH